MAGQALQLAEKSVANVSRFYHGRVPAFAKETLKWAAEKEHILNLLRSSKTLKNCLPETIEQTILHAAAMGLSFNPSRPGVYAIPRLMWRGDPNSKAAERRVDGPLISHASPSYMGLSQVAVQSGFASIIRAQVVFNTDRFEFRGPLDKPEHVLDHLKPMTWERAAGVYGLAKLSDGSFACEWIDKDTIERIRALSDWPGGLMWDPRKLWTEGWKKTVIRRMFKTIPVDMGPSLTLATKLMNEHEGITIDGTAVRVNEATADPDVTGNITVDQGIEIRDKAEEAGLKLERLLGAYHVAGVDDIPASMYQPVLDRIASYGDRKTTSTE